MRWFGCIGTLLLVLAGPALTETESINARIPEPDLHTLETDVRSALQTARADLDIRLADPQASPENLAADLGSLGRLYQAHLLSDAATACFTLATELAPGDYRWHYHLGHVLERSGHLQDAVAAYTRSLELKPQSALTRLRLGQVLSQAGQLDQARPLLQQAALDPALQAAAQYELGKLAYAQRDYAAARSALEQALVLQPSADRIHYTLALVRRALGDVQQARIHLASRGDKQPSFPDPLIDPLQGLSTGQRMLFHRGMDAAHQRDFAAAAQRFREGLGLVPGNHAARISLARFLFLAGEKQAAQQELGQIPNDAEDAALAGLLLGVLLQDAGDLQGAATHYQAALVREPGHPGLHYYLANALYRTGEFSAAADHYRASLQRAEGNAGARFWGIMAAIRAGSPHAALKPQLEAAWKRHPDNPAVSYFLAALLAASPDPALRDGERALELAQTLQRRRPSPDHSELLAMAQAEKGDFAAARASQQQALDQAWAGRRWDLLKRLEQGLAAYRQNLPCRVPWTEVTLAWKQPPFDAAKVFESYPTSAPY